MGSGVDAFFRVSSRGRRGLWWGSPCVGVTLGFLYGVSALRPPAARARLGLAVESGRAALISSLSTPSSNSRYGTPPAQQDTRDSNTAAHPFLQHTYTRIGTSSRGGQRLGGGRQSGRAPVESRGQALYRRKDGRVQAGDILGCQEGREMLLVLSKGAAALLSWGSSLTFQSA